MTTYTTIPNSDIDQDSPVTQPLMTALRDNPIAITEGAASAPRIVGLAATKIDDMPTLSVSAADTETVSTGTTRTDGTSTTASTSYVTAQTIVIGPYSGTIRFKYAHRTNNSSFTSSLQLLKNASVVATWTTTSINNVERSSDVSVTVGDTIVWQHKISVASTQSVATSRFPTANKAYRNMPLYIDSSEGI